jgi:uncharacterized membrane protein
MTEIATIGLDIAKSVFRLGFDEIRQYGAGSVQVMRRLRSALVGVVESFHYLDHLDLTISRSRL